MLNLRSSCNLQLTRVLFPLLLALTLLFALQTGGMHALSHALEEQEQQDDKAPHSPACVQCAAYTQLGSAVNGSAPAFLLVSVPDAMALYVASAFRSTELPTAVARGRPALLQEIA